MLYRLKAGLMIDFRKENFVRSVQQEVTEKLSTNPSSVTLQFVANVRKSYVQTVLQIVCVEVHEI